MTIKQIISAYSQHEDTPCPLTEKLVTAGYQQTHGGYIYDRKRWNKEIQKLCFDRIASVINQIQ